MKKKNIFLSLVIIILIAVFWIPHKFYHNINDNRNIIKVGITADYPPFVFLENHQIVGFDIDIIKKIADKLNKKIKFIDMAFNVLIPGIQNGKIDIVVGGLTPDPQRMNHVFFTHPYLANDPLVIITMAPQEAKSVGDLTDKVVIVNEGYTADFYMSKIKGPILKRLSSVADAIMALRSGKAYAFVSALIPLQPFFKQYGKEQFHINALQDKFEEYAIVASKQHPALHKKIDEVLQTMIKDGTIEKLKTNWKLYD